MSSLVTEFDSVFTPAGRFEGTWHNLHKPLVGPIALDGSNVQPALRPIVECGFRPDFSGEISVPADLRAELGDSPVDGWKLLLSDARPDAHGVLYVHVCKKSYTVHQNSVNFSNSVAALRAVFGDGGFELATVGTLGGHSQFFLSVYLTGESETEFAPGDRFNSFFNVVSSHNSLVSTGYHFSNVRIVCMNTVKMSLADADATGNKSTVRHTINSGELITPGAIEKNIRAWQAEKSAFFAAMLAAKSTPMTLAQFQSFSAGVFTTEKSDFLSSVSFNRIEEMAQLFTRGAGNRGDSLYDAYNAWTQYFTHGNGVGGSNVSTRKRLASANDGQGNLWKLQALRCGATAESLAETLRRGERMYNDKLIANSAKAAGK